MEQKPIIALIYLLKNVLGVRYGLVGRGNRSYLFDFAWYFRSLDYLRVVLKKILTKLRLRDKQSCKYCGRDQHIVWRCTDEDWLKIPQRWHNKALCLECFISLYPEKLKLENIEIVGYDCGFMNYQYK